MTDAPAVPGLAPQEDYVDGPSTDVLLGAVLEYRYTRGARYRLVFDRDSHHLTFSVLSVPGGTPARPGPPPPVLAYRAREIRDGLVLVHWTVPEPGFHVVLTIDLIERRVHVAAMMPPNRWEFFDTGEITSVERATGPG